ncbi:MAG: THxN family PEP-CTERM protein [Pseudomonadota bacterium]
MLSRKTKLALVAAASMLVSVAAQAVPVFSLTNVTGVWQNVVPQSALTEIEYQTVGGVTQVRWGQNVKPINQKSGYGFDGAAPAAVPFFLGTDFLLGTFTHYNLPISLNSSILSAELLVNFSITVDDVVVGDVVLASFLHNETNNQTCSPKPSCTDDHVTLTATSGTTIFNYAGFEYTLDIIGFSTNGGATTIETFDTIENRNNTAGLYATLTSRPISVPEPGTLGLFGMALLAIGFMKRRQTV